MAVLVYLQLNAVTVYRIWMGLCCLALMGPATAGPVRFECPQELPAALVKVDSPRPGWKTFCWLSHVPQRRGACKRPS